MLFSFGAIDVDFVGFHECLQPQLPDLLVHKFEPGPDQLKNEAAFNARELITHSRNSWNSGSATQVGILSWRRIFMNSKSMVFELSALLCNAHSPDNTDKAVNSVVRKAIELLSFNAFEMRAQAPGSSTTISKTRLPPTSPPCKFCAIPGGS